MVSHSLFPQRLLIPAFAFQSEKLRLEREGKDVTIVAFSKMVGYSLKAAEILAKEGISAEVINLRSIRPLDTAAINTSVRKTNRLITVEERFPQHGIEDIVRAAKRACYRSEPFAAVA